MTTIDNSAAEQLKAIVERVETRYEEKRAVDDDIKDIYAEAKGTGFDVKAIKTIIAMRRKDPQEVRESEAILDTYLNALSKVGMTTPVSTA